jgi:hypothetical protein
MSKHQSLYMKKHSLSSATTDTPRLLAHRDSTNLSPLSTARRQVMQAVSARRYTVIPPPDIADKFWVPEEIAQNAKLEKQRRSLPFENGMRKEIVKEMPQSIEDDEDNEDVDDTLGKT